MSITKPISREYRIYLALWRKAFLNPDEPVKVKASGFSMAVAMRQGMYRAIRPFRNGQMNDKELQDAAEKYVIYLDKSSNTIEFRERKALAELEHNFDLLGIDEEDLLLGDERTISTKLSAFLEEKPAEPVSTPFYTRD